MKRSALSFAGVPALDYGARLYSAETGRWLSQDPLGEEYYWMSPYAYCAGNPVDFVDPEGMDIWELRQPNSRFYVYVHLGIYVNFSENETE